MKKNFDKKLNYKKKWTFSGNVAQSFDGHIKNLYQCLKNFIGLRASMQNTL